MFRRALATIELGKNEWAYWDLVVATDISPNNQDVVKKLEEVKNSIHRRKSEGQNQVQCPKGIGPGLPPQKRNSKDFLTEGHVVDQKDSQGTALTLVGKEDDGDQFDRSSQAERCRNLDNMETGHSDDCPQVQEKEMQKGVIKDEEMEEAGKWNSATEISSTVTEDANLFSSECNDEVSTPHNMEEPIYRFRNHKKKGSTLSISKSNYLLMTQGKSLNFYNPKLGSFMEVKIVTRQEKGAAVTGDSVHCQNQSPLETMTQDHMDIEEVRSAVGSCVTSDNTQSEVRDDASSATQSPAVFKFSSMSNSNARRNQNVKSHSAPRVPVMKTKRRKLLPISHVPFSHTNFASNCRIEVGRKRKCAYLLPVDSNHHPRKKPTPRACPMNQCILCPCTNDCNAGSTSNRYVCNAAQVLATSARKGW